MLWARHHRVGPSVAVAVIASAVVRGLVLLITSDGSGIEVAPLWIATVCAVPLLFMFTTETDADRTAPRSLAARRWALLGIAVLTSGVIALAAFPTAIGEWGLIATWRDAVALLGLGLLSLAVLPPAAIWVAPLVAALASMMFSWPLHPGLSLGLWGALRAPADLLLDPGVPNLSIPLCLLIGAAGVVVLVNGLTWTPRPAAPHRRSVMPHHRSVMPHRSSARGGIRRASLAVPTACLVAIVSAWPWVTSLSWWGGSPRLLLAGEIPASFFIAIPCAVLAGVVTGQYRWRSGVAVWQKLSGRPAWTLLGRACGAAALTTVIAVGTPALVMALMATWDLASHDVGASVVATEFLAGWPPTLVVLAEVAAAAVLGVCAGWWNGRIWLAPACLILALAAMIATPRPPTQDVDQLWADRYGYTTCATVTGHDVTVCAPVPDKGYLPAAVTTVSQIYDQSAHPEALPRLIHLTTTGTMGGGMHPMGLEHPPDLGAAPGRGLTPPTALGSAAGDSLSYSTQAWCAGTDLADLQKIFGVEQYVQTPTMGKTLAALQKCRG
ncbi:hypothetical protein C0Z11_12820 [Acidipropionibacterium jensenii]|nr:hypothetical protein C0Z11_12820 [Acidipropionibacterium jensenii]